MGTRTVRDCDVYGTTKEIRRFTVEITDIESDPITILSGYEVDLSPRALARLRKFIERGVTKPSADNPPTEAKE